MRSLLVQECVSEEFSRGGQAVKVSLDDIEELLEEVCDFIASESHLKTWLPSRKRKREDGN